MFIRLDRNNIRVLENENRACRKQTCGARGGYGTAASGSSDFKLASRRTIRYLPRLLASHDYAAAVAEYEGWGK